MKNITDFINEALNVVTDMITEGEVKSEKDFREYAENKFKEVFGDELDEQEMKDTIDGLLKDNKELVDAGEWGELVGMLNKSFAK
jgi:nicotinate-nucleotide pyrophosphorylase